MNYNIDGFNERTNFIHNSNDLNKSKKNPRKIDMSLAEMRISENKSGIKTYSEKKELDNSNREYMDINQFKLFNNYKKR